MYWTCTDYVLYEYIPKYREVSGLYTAKTQYRKFKTNFSEKELRGLSPPNFHIHVSVNDLYILEIGLPIPVHENMWTDPGHILYV